MQTFKFVHLKLALPAEFKLETIKQQLTTSLTAHRKCKKTPAQPVFQS